MANLGTVILSVFRFVRRGVDRGVGRRRLAEVLPGRRPQRQEVVRGERTGILALYDDEVVFVPLDDDRLTRIALIDITDVHRRRSLDSLESPGDPSSSHGDTGTPDWMLTIEWQAGGARIDGAWEVRDADDWIASLARARL